MAPEKPKPPLFFIFGLSHSISVIILIIISLALLSIVAVFGLTWTSQQSRVDSISIQSVRIVNIAPGTFLVKVTVGNTGTSDISLTRIFISESGCSISPNTIVKPGQTYSSSFTCQGLTVNTRYNVVVEGIISSSNKRVGDAVWAMVEA